MHSLYIYKPPTYYNPVHIGNDFTVKSWCRNKQSRTHTHSHINHCYIVISSQVYGVETITGIRTCTGH